MKILLFGGAGQLGKEIQKRAADLNFEVVSPVVKELDISEKDQVIYLARQVKPDVILNSAAFTAVDQAEQEQELAFQINRDGAAYAAMAARQSGARLIHISTDYVFSGEGKTPLKESDPTDPRSVYGASKLAGEQAVLEENPERSVIVRTSSLHGAYGHNFVHTMLSLFEQKDELRVVNDQIMSPTWAGWLSEVLLDICRTDHAGILHASGRGAISWFDFATRIYEYSRQALNRKGELKIIPATSQEYTRPAPRPAYSVLDCSLLARVIGREIPGWEIGLEMHLREINKWAPMRFGA